MRNHIHTVMARSGALLLLACLVLGAGCTLAPKYQRPDAPIPSRFVIGPEETDAPENLGWKDFFTDPVMQRLILMALEENRDLRIALLNVEKTRQQYRIQRADLLPTIAASGQITRQSMPAELSGIGERSLTSQYTVGLGFSSFELDLFGRIRSLTDRALELYYSVDNEANAAQMTLVAEVAGMYLQLVADRELLDFTKETLNNRQAHYDSMEKRFASGIISELELNQAKASLEEAKMNLAQRESQVTMDSNMLELLLGRTLPEDLPEVRKLAQVEPMKDVPPGLPSQLLIRRPDIMAAEHQLKAANANIGAARANFFPTISLTGALGTLSLDYHNLFKAGTSSWSFLPAASLPLFDTGRNIAVFRTSKVEKEIAVATYEKTIQNAFREVADALAMRRTMGLRLDADAARAAAAERTYQLALARYNAGIDSYLVLLDTQRVNYEAQQSLIGTRLLRESNSLGLYKALGGGWQ